MIKTIKELQKVYKEKLLLKKKKFKNLNNLNVFLNVLKKFSGLRFFKVNKYTFDGFVYLSNLYLRNQISILYYTLLSKGLYFYAKKVLKIKIFKKEYNLLLKFLKRWEKNVEILKKFYRKSWKSFIKSKFKYKKIKKIRYLVKSRKYFKKKK